MSENRSCEQPAQLEKAQAKRAERAEVTADWVVDGFDRFSGPITRAVVRAAIAEALDLGIDDARIDRADDVVAEPEPFDRAGREVGLPALALRLWVKSGHSWINELG